MDTRVTRGLILNALSIGAVALLVSTAQSARADDSTAEIGAQTVVSGATRGGQPGNSAGAGAEATFNISGKSGWYDPTYYSVSASAGWVGTHPTGSLDYTVGYENARQTMLKGEVTANNARLDVIGGDLMYKTLGGTGEFRAFVGLYGFQYNWLLAGDGAMRALPVAISYLQKIGDKVAVKGSVEHAFLIGMDQSNLPNNQQAPSVDKSGGGYNHDLTAAIEGFFQVTPNLSLSAGAVVEDTRYTSLKNQNQPSQYFLTNEATAVTGKIGATLVF